MERITFHHFVHQRGLFFDMMSITLSNEGAIAAAAAAVACAMRYWQLRTAELNKAKDVGNQFKAAKTLSLKDMIVIGNIPRILSFPFASYFLIYDGQYILSRL